MKKHIKKHIKRIGGTVIFIAILLVMTEFIATAFYPMNDVSKSWTCFYKQEKNSIDALVVGSSHAFASFDMQYLSEQTGENYYLLASNSQNVTQTYYNLKEALKYQKPKTIILEAFGIDRSNNWQTDTVKEKEESDSEDQSDDKDWKKESNIDGMRWGIPKIQAIVNQYRIKNWPYATLKINRVHQNWKNVGQLLENYDFYRRGYQDFPLFRPSASVMSEETHLRYKNMGTSDKEFVVSEVNREHFRKLADLCNENGIRLVVVMAPMYDEYIQHINYQSQYQTLLDMTEEAKVEYIDGNMYYNEIGLTAEDFEDAYNTYHHFNYSGAKKFGAFIADKL